MKKIVLTVLTLTLTTSLLFAQSIDFGAKAGLNYNFGGDLSEVSTEVGNSFNNLISGADSKAGFHLGLWAKMDVLGLYIRPELVYTQLNNSYDNSAQAVNTNFTTKKIDIPILIGAKIAGPLHVFAGPSFQYITKTGFSQSDFTNIKKKDFTAGLQIGAGLDFGKLGIDVRWEKGFSNDVDGEFANTNINVDNRPNQIIFGLSFKLNDNNSRRRR
ncbi:MAG TPA: hypothetical protein DDZ39_08905 [Flavobacteriaceae bacterium]|jgi:hypothetical protein|nr:hypothetical protein [Flavobacteriaceae bacterium]HBS12612.1 hypothetical protein [Flavobacteriaceae bacterium]